MTAVKLTKEEKLEAERERIRLMRSFEDEYAHLGYIAGVDEVGRGPLCGPVVTAAVILPKDCEILYLNDSKKLSEKRRELLFPEIMEKAVAVGIASCSPEEIDSLNILNATKKAMREAVLKLNPSPACVLVDAVTIPGLDIKQVPIIKGDAKSLSIAAASVIAKVTRDRLMVELDAKYPGYGFASNKGYGTAEHIAALKTLGPCEIHRRSFIKNFIEG